MATSRTENVVCMTLPPRSGPRLLRWLLPCDPYLHQGHKQHETKGWCNRSGVYCGQVAIAWCAGRTHQTKSEKLPATQLHFYLGLVTHQVSPLLLPTWKVKMISLVVPATILVTTKDTRRGKPYGTERV